MSPPPFALPGSLGPSDLLVLVGFLLAYALATVVLVRFRPVAAPTLAGATRCPHCGAPHEPGYRFCANCVGSITGR